jgi:hypothetical protein
MLNRLSDLVRLRTFAAAQVQPVGRVDFAALSDLLPGDFVRATVESALPDGTFRVAIRKQVFILRLPFQARGGDVLPLRVVAREPQIKFALVTEPDIPELAADLSETARFVAALLDESEKLPLTSIGRAGAPLLTGTPGDSAATAAALRHALAHSGMFYEAHQAQWVGGQRALAALMQEPQSRFKPLRDADEAPPIAEGADHSGEIVVVDGTHPLPELPVHRDALPLIKQQLDTLETRQIAWSGMIWQGQPLDWEVAEDSDYTPQPADERRWRTRLRLTLPRLGAIEATMLVNARGVAITLRAATREAGAALETRAEELRQSLRTAGVTPLGLTVHGDETA